MISFRVDDADVAAVEQWAMRLGIDRSELLRDALRRHLTELAAEQEIRAYRHRPLSREETSLGEIADWGPAEEWSDWADAKG
jgi:Arc/MetJ-type ribon-helix-helix transcriptional regulator